MRTIRGQGEVGALSAYYMDLTSYAGTVHFVGTNGLIVPPDYTFTPADNGKHTFTFTPNGGGDAWLSVTETADSWVFGGRTISVGCPTMVVTASNAQPRGVSISSEQRTTLSVGATGTNLQFNWYRGIAPDRTQLVASGPDRHFTTPPLTTTTSYWVEVLNTCGAAQSATADVVIGGRRRAAGH